jgi:hypothetical protein
MFDTYTFVLGILAICASVPIGIVWIVTNARQERAMMKYAAETDNALLERVTALEARLAALEAPKSVPELPAPALTGKAE